MDDKPLPLTRSSLSQGQTFTNPYNCCLSIVLDRVNMFKHASSSLLLTLNWLCMCVWINAEHANKCYMFDSMREGQQRSRCACCLSQLLIRCVGLQAEFSSQPPSGSITIEPGALFTPQTAQHPDNLLTMLQPTWKRLFYGQYQAVVIPLCGFLWFLSTFTVCRESGICVASIFRDFPSSPLPSIRLHVCLLANENCQLPASVGTTNMMWCFFPFILYHKLYVAY